MHKNRPILRFLNIILVVIILFSASTAARPVAAAAPADPLAPPSESVRILRATPQGLVLEFAAPDPTFTPSQQAGSTCLELTLPGLARLDQPGLPSLPVQGAMLGIPQSAQPELILLAAETAPLPIPGALCLGQRPRFSRGASNELLLSGYAPSPLPAAAASAWNPAAAAELVSSGSLRSQRFAQIRFNPLQYLPQTGELRFTRRIQVELRFNTANTAPLDATAPVSEGVFEPTLQNLLLNYDQALPWRSRVSISADAEMLTIDAALDSSPAYKIAVNRDGLYQISYADLIDADIPAATLDTLDPHTFQLTHQVNQVNEVAILVEGEADGSFDPGDYLLFYGEGVESKYTDTNIYWLTWGGAAGLRMANLPAAPSGAGEVPLDFLTTQRAEVDVDYYSDEPSGAELDHWYWELVSAYQDPAFVDFPIQLDHISAQAHPITLRGALNGYYTSNYHHTLLHLNGTLVDSYTFPYGAEYHFSIPLAQSNLVEGSNNLRLELPVDGGLVEDYVLMNWFEIDYYDTYFAESDRLFFDGDSAGTLEFQVDGFSSAALEAYDITDPFLPRRINGAVVSPTANGQQLAFEVGQTSEGHYLAQVTDQRLSPLSIQADTSSNWKSESVGADYIILSHAAFLSAIQPLAAYHAGQGLRVQVVDIQDVYDEFNGGVFAPEAIQSFIAYAYANWSGAAPSFVLLVGDGHYDFKDIKQRHEVQYLPPFLADVDPWVGETSADNRYVAVSGSDILPDLAIGRFPVRSAAEAQVMVNKVINYETNQPLGGWNAYQTFVADNTDSGGNFPVISDGIITFVPATYTVNKVYYGVTHTSGGDARAAIQASINAGRLLLHYVGHGSRQQWASEGLLKLSDVAALTNGDKLPLILAMTCSEGYFIMPSAAGSDNSALAEGIVRASGKGAIASWSPTGYGLSSGHDLLDRSFFDQLFNNHQTQLGFLTTTAKAYLYANSASYNDLIDTFMLFGDPALELQVLAPPAAPTELQAGPVSSSQIHLSWVDNSDETDFLLERSPVGEASWTQIASLPAGTTTYDDSGLACSSAYDYRLRAYRAGDGQYSAYSNTASAATFACRSLSLIPGWNLITLPLTPASAFNAETLLQAINAQGGTCTSAADWVNSGWTFHPLGAPYAKFAVSMGKGYFIKCSLGSTWLVEGTALSSGVTLSLVPGYNLVGIPYPVGAYNAQGLLTAINAQGVACSSVARWYNSGWQFFNNGQAYNNYSIEADKGYFVKCSASGAFTP